MAVVLSERASFSNMCLLTSTPEKIVLIMKNSSGLIVLPPASESLHPKKIQLSIDELRHYSQLHYFLASVYPETLIF